jgi:glycosyltransferase involved in cell wall biosynthesis
MNAAPIHPESVSVIIPCYNEAANIAPVIHELKHTIDEMTASRWEVIVVDDGSTDSTAAEVDDLEWVQLIRHPENRGYGASLKTGIRAASGDVILTFDGDGQHNPAEISNLLTNMEGYDMSAGARVSSSGVPLARRPGKWFLSLTMNYLCRAKIPDVNCGMRAIRRNVILRYLHLCSDRFSFSMSSTLALLSEGHFTRFVDVNCRTRQGEVSQVRLNTALDALLTLMRLTIVFHPFRVFLPIASILGLAAIGFLGYDVYHVDITDTTLLLMISSLFVLLFGLISDQIARIRRELKPQM